MLMVLQHQNSAVALLKDATRASWSSRAAGPALLEDLACHLVPAAPEELHAPAVLCVDGQYRLQTAVVA